MRSLLTKKEKNALCLQLLATLERNILTQPSYTFSEESLLLQTSPSLMHTYDPDTIKKYVHKFFTLLRSHDFIRIEKYKHKLPLEHQICIFNPNYRTIYNYQTRDLYSLREIFQYISYLLIHDTNEVKEIVYRLALAYRDKSPSKRFRPIINGSECYMKGYLLEKGCPLGFIRMLKLSSFDPLYTSIYTVINGFLIARLFRASSDGWGIS